MTQTLRSSETAETLTTRLADARARTDEIFARLAPDALYERPIPERHRLVFYLGHLEAFDQNLLGQAYGLESFHPAFDKLFAFGIDPTAGGLPNERTLSLYFFRSNFAPSRALACSRNARCSVTPTK